jgi:hypothetical protein
VKDFWIIASGAATFKDIEWNSIGELIFDDKMFLKYLELKYFELKYDALHYILSLYSKKDFFDYSLGGYSHRERWARTR